MHKNEQVETKNSDKDPELVYRKYADIEFNAMIPRIKEQALSQILNIMPPPIPSNTANRANPN